VASYGPRIVNRIKRLFGIGNSKKGQGEPFPAKGGPQYGKSPLSNAYVNYHKYREIQKFHEKQMGNWTFTSTFVPNDCDEVAEVFLDDEGNIKEPLVRGTAFDFCKLDRWYMPDCVPGIISKVDITYAGRPNEHPGDMRNQGRPSKIITVLHANDKYIHLAPRSIFYIEPDDEYYAAVEAHFIRRGIDFVREQDVNSKDWENWAKTFGTPHGSNKTSTYTGSNGRRYQNSPIITHWGPDFSSYSSYSCTVAEAKIAAPSNGPATWTTSGP
jgi:hypothetical protein